MNKRQRDILSFLTTDKRKSVNELAEQLEVSGVTIRQDLRILEKEGLLTRIHGGAEIQNPDDIANRLGINYSVKQRIAAEAATHIQNGETILIESGSANALLAKTLSDSGPLTVVTTNAFIARQLKGARRINVILVGGVYQHESESIVGNLARTCIDSLNFTKSFIGVDGYTHETGFTSSDMMRAEISAYIIKKSSKSFIVSDSSKFGRINVAPICGAHEIDCIITDNNIPPSACEELRASGVTVITC